MPNSFFHFRQFSILQQDKGLKVTTDACLLGAFASSPSAREILDIGTGTGVLAIMAAQQHPQARITAIDLSAEVCEQAAFNAAGSSFGDRIQVLQADFRIFAPEARYDLIVCNPPYFRKHLLSPDELRNRAMHSDTLTPQELMKGVSGLLKEDGRFYCMYPADHGGHQLITETARGYGLFPAEMVNVQNAPGKDFRILYRFGKEEKQAVSTGKLLLHESDGSRSEAFHRLMLPFYPENTEIYKRRKK